MTSEPRDVEAALNLRTFIERLRQAGKLKEMQNAHWDLEIGALTEIAAESGEGSALLFDGIADYPEGFRVLSNVLRSPESDALALGMPPDVRGLDVVRAVKRRLQDLKPVPPAEVGESPLLENVAFGGDVNLLKFPTPKWHAGDGGRYIGTFTATVCRDPDTGYVNVGTYRIQVHDENTLGVWMISGKHGDLIARKYWARGEACPVAVICGLPPGMMTASAVGIPWNMSEYDFLGGMLETPVPVIKGRKTGLPVPAFADLVFEGLHSAPGAGKPRGGAVRRVARVLRLGVAAGSRGEGGGGLSSRRAHHHRRSAAQDLPQQRDPQVHPLGQHLVGDGTRGHSRGGRGVVPGPGALHGDRRRQAALLGPRQAGRLRRARHPRRRPGRAHGGSWWTRTWTSPIPGELLWAMSTRWDPRADSEILDVAASILNPRLSPEDKRRRELTTSCMVVDACRPYGWKDEFPKISGTSAEYKAEILAKWGGRL